MKPLVIGCVVVLGVAAAASAQTPDDAAEQAQIRARQQISTMEGVLRAAVQHGVDNLRRRVRAVMPDDALLMGGLPEVRGFPIDGYGLFFDVEVPGLRQSMAWTLRSMNEVSLALTRDLQRIRQFVQSLPNRPPELDRAVENLQRQIGPPQPAAAGLAERTGMQATTAADATVSAQSLAAAAPAPAGPPLRQEDLALMLDPAQAYTTEVRDALVDAMITFGGPLMLGPDQWLTVAAKDNEPVNPLVQGDPDVVTMILSIQGRDLIAFQTGQMTKDEVRARVQVRQF